MSTRAGTEQPVQFGPHGLFGLYHPAASDSPRGAVLLCAPIGQDQVRSHRLYRQLAHALVGEGYAVLRYDCYGSGDSPGASDAVDWQRCIDDTVTAAAELRRLSGCNELVGYGARLGGSLALAAAPQAHFIRLIVWDAVLDGARHVTQLDAWQDRLRQDPDRFIKPRSAADASGQWLGFATGPALRTQLMALKATAPGVPTLLLQSADAEADAEQARLLAAGARCNVLSAPSPWLDFDRLETTVLSPEMIHAVCAALQGAA